MRPSARNLLTYLIYYFLLLFTKFNILFIIMLPRVTNCSYLFILVSHVSHMFTHFHMFQYSLNVLECFESRRRLEKVRESQRKLEIVGESVKNNVREG